MKRLAKILGVGLALLVIIGVGGLQLYDAAMISPIEKDVRRIFTPVVAALEEYHQSKGKYPEKLSALVPAYIKELPSCPQLPAGRIKLSSEISYYLHAGSYDLGCYIGIIVYPQRAVYFSEGKFWGRLDW